MANVCIITDSTAQFTQPNFPGHERVHVISFTTQNILPGENGYLPGELQVKKRLISPSPEDFVRLYTSLGHQYDSILVLTISSLLAPTMQHALAASSQYVHSASVEVIDSQTTTIGLGMLVQMAAGMANEGASLKEIDKRLRASIPSIYMLLFIPELTHLAYAGLMNLSQAVVAEMMGMLPVFTFEEGRLVPMEKVRTPRHLFEAFQDFLGEFEYPSEIALMHNPVRGNLRTSPLHQYIVETFPEAFFSEHRLQPHPARLFGSHSIGLAVMETPDKRHA
jgi:DegV family protein with EDD domain